MNDTQLILFDDEHARHWFPFTLTRPAGELLFGCVTMRARIEQVFGLRCIGHVTDHHLAGFDEPDAPPVIDIGQADASRARLFLSSRAVPSWSAQLPEQPSALRIGQEIVGFFCPPGRPSPSEAELLSPQPRTAAELPGITLRHVWELVSRSAEQVSNDVAFHHDGRWSRAPVGVRVIGEPKLAMASGVSIEPGVVLDFRNGPICLEEGVEVRAFTRLAGPVSVGRKSTLLGGSFTAVTIGPRCKVHGEVEETVILGYSNKAHDGFLGHAYVGSWVNLGALTTNSDLKNNYGPVRLWTPLGEVDTGTMKIGCFLGDHVKTAIGCMINTGTVVGPGSNLFGGMPPKWVPPFSWGAQLGEYEFEKFIATAEIAMARRDITLSARQRELLRRAHERGRALAAGVTQ